MLYTSCWLAESMTDSKLLDTTDHHLFGSFRSLVVCLMSVVMDFKSWQLNKPCPLLLVNSDVTTCVFFRTHASFSRYCIPW